MNILITQRHDINKHGQWVDILENDYVKYFEPFGIHLVPIPNVTRDIEAYFKLFNIERVILSGGNDVDPSTYNESEEGATGMSKQRDKLELKVIDFAIKENIPVLGVCRGIQILNVSFGGTLFQDLGEIDRQAEHKVSIVLPANQYLPRQR